ncbi:MAG: transketolase [Bacillota bacterium]
MKTDNLKDYNGSWQDDARRVAAGIRRRVLEHTIKNNGGYLSQACSSAEIFATLYTRVMKLGKVERPMVPAQFTGVPGPENPHYSTGALYNGPKCSEFDRFFLSPAQYALVLYAALIETGRMAENGLDHFNKDGSIVEMIGAEHSPGMEVMTGSLGQGISQAAGIAMARKLKGETGRIVLFLSDGECQSGQFWEAVQEMSFHKLDNMIAYVDVNGYQCDGKMTNVMNIEPFDKRLESFGARVFRIDGHDIDTLAALGNLKPDGRPTFILCDTNACAGIRILEKRVPKLHYVRFGSEDEKEQYKSVLSEMDLKEGI